MSRIYLIGDTSFTCQTAQLAAFKLPARLARCSVVSGLAPVLASRHPDEHHVGFNVLSSFALASMLGCETEAQRSEAVEAMITTFATVLRELLEKDSRIIAYVFGPLKR